MGALADELAHAERGLVLVMGKGGVGKTTVAAALAVALAARVKSVYLSTTDPAAHMTATLAEAVPGLKVDRIDPKAETQRYIARIMASRGGGLDDAGRALLLEDLQSPCTEEVAVFHAFSRLVSEAHAGNHSRHRSRGASGRPAACRHRAICLGDKPQLVGRGRAIGCSPRDGSRTDADRPRDRKPGAPNRPSALRR